MAVIIARTGNSIYVIDTAAERVERHRPDGRCSTIAVFEVVSARPASEADAGVRDKELIRGPQGQALVPMPETTWSPVVGRRIVLRVKDGGPIVTTPVISVAQSVARAA